MNFSWFVIFSREIESLLFCKFINIEESLSVYMFHERDDWRGVRKTGKQSFLVLTRLKERNREKEIS